MVTERSVRVRGIIYKDGKLFAQRLKQKDGAPVDYWSTPGGGLELGEPIKAGLHREMIEETGVAPQIGRLLFVQQFVAQGTEREQLELIFHIENADDYGVLDLSATTHGELEVAECGFIDPTQENLWPEILRRPDLADLIDNPGPVVLINELER